MKTYAVAYLATAAIFFALDFLWLGTVARTFYRDQLGDLMLPQPNLVAAVGFYALYIVGVLIFAVLPALASGSWTAALVSGALFGFFAYATYDLTNLATLRNWPIVMTFVDLAWGTALTGVAAAGGFLATRAIVGAS